MFILIIKFKGILIFASFYFYYFKLNKEFNCYSLFYYYNTSINLNTNINIIYIIIKIKINVNNLF